jgi:O-antigen/teichoic acid export membrane protein
MNALGRQTPLAPPTPGEVGVHRGGLYGLLLALASVLGLAKTVALAQILGAGDLGYYGVVVLVLPFGTYLSTAGSLAALGAELPVAYGARDPDVAGLRDRALGLVVLSITFVTALYLAIVALASPHDPNMRTALLLAALTVALNSVFEFYLTVLRARVRLIPLASAYLGRSALAFVATLSAGAAFGYKGAILAEAAALAAALLYIARALEPSVAPRTPRRRESARLIRSGILLSLANVMLAISIFADRSFVAATLPEELGQYTFAAVIAVAWFAVTGFVAQAVGSSALHDYGGGLALSEVRRRVGRACAIVLGLAVAGLPVIVLLTDRLKELGFAQYAAGLDVLPMLYVGGALSAVSLYSYLLLAMRRYGLVLVATSSGVAAGLVGGILIALGSPTLADYAWLFLGSQATIAVATVIAGELVYHSTRRLSAS